MRVLPTLRTILLAALVGAPPALAANAAPGARELASQLRATYRSLTSYRDRGRLLIEVPGQATLESSFSLAADDAGGFLWILGPPDSPDDVREVIWRNADALWQWDSAGNRYRRLAAIETAFARRLRGAARELLVVPSLLAGDPDALDEAARAARVEGPIPCGDRMCWRWRSTPGQGEVRTDYWIEIESGLVDRVEIEIESPEAVVARAMGRPRPADSASPTRLRIEHRGASVEPPRPAVAFVAPPGAELTQDWGTPPGASQLAGVFGETVDVDVQTVVVRVVDSLGEPIRNLGPEDFRVRVGSREVEPLACDWVATRRLHPPGPDGRVATSPAEATRPELVVFFVQTGLDSSYMIGNQRFLRYAQEILPTFDPDTWIAVLSFDSRLKLRQDFTHDRGRLEEALEAAVRYGGEGTERKGREPSLARHLDFRTARRSGAPEKAIRLIGEALQAFDGAKTMVYLGWGLGELTRTGVSMTPHYDPALRALRDAEVTVFVLDITDASYHSLEVGLEKIARDTGGTYEKTAVFPERAAKRLARTLGGYYVLSFDREAVEGGGRLRIDLRDRKGQVLTPEIRYKG